MVEFEIKSVTMNYDLGTFSHGAEIVCMFTRQQSTN